MSIQSPAKCEICIIIIIHYLIWKEKTPVEVYKEVKTAYGDKAMIVQVCLSGVANLKMVVHLCMIRGAEDLQL